MKLITAPNKIEYDSNNPAVFLAGGITDCWGWQEAVVDNLEQQCPNQKGFIYNPRRENFPIDDPNASLEQIKWEVKALTMCNIFSMFFCNSNSVQPICMYELGRYIEVKKHQYPDDYKQRIIVSIEGGYSRAQDVKIQCNLAGIYVFENTHAWNHADAIAKAINDIYGR